MKLGKEAGLSELEAVKLAIQTRNCLFDLSTASS